MDRVYYELHTTYKTIEQAQKAADQEAKRFTEYGDTVLETWAEPRKYYTSFFDDSNKQIKITVNGWKAVVLYIPYEA